MVPQPKTLKWINPRDEFALDGDFSPIGVVLRSVITLRDEAKALEIVKRVMNSNTLSNELSEPDGRVSVPLDRVFDVQALIQMYIFEVSSAEVSDQQRTAIVRLFLHHALMTMLYRDGHPAAKRVVRKMVDIGTTMSATENEQLAKIYKAAACNLVAHDGDFPEALRALGVARKAAPADLTIMAMLIILSLKLNRLEEAWHLIGKFEETGREKALLYWLKADYFGCSDQPDKAITAFEEAITLEPKEEHRKVMHFNATFAYAMAENLSAREQADGMIRHLEDAVRIEDNPVLHVLKAYGWALRGNSKQFEAELAKTAALMGVLTEDGRKAMRPFIENWKARGLRKLGQPSQVAENVLSVMGSSIQGLDVANLVVLAGAALDLTEGKGGSEHLVAAERYVDRAIELESDNEEALRLRALIWTIHAENASDPDAAGRFREKAREGFLRLLRLGHEMPVFHSVLARLYEADDDPVNAAKHRRRWLELSPGDFSAIAYQALTILDQTGDLALAKAHLAGIEGRSEEVGKVYRLVAVSALKHLGADAEVKKRISVLEDARECLLKAIDFGDKEEATCALLKAVLDELEMY